MNVFISYSHKDKRYLDRLLVHLKPLERHRHIDTWSDIRIQSAERWRDEIQEALLSSQVGILLVSADFLASDFITSNELPPLLLRAEQNKCQILPIVVGPCLFQQIQALQQFQAANPPDKPLSNLKRAQQEKVLRDVAERVLRMASPDQHLDRESEPPKRSNSRSRTVKFKGSPEIDAIISGVKLGNWDSAESAALQVIQKTHESGTNEIFEKLLAYQDCSSEDDRFWGASHTIESCVQLAPWLIRHEQLAKMAKHPHYSVRSTAASICMHLANSAPDRVPIDLLLKLSVHDEDWYVQAPAVAAIKGMANIIPSALCIFYERLHSQNADARTHAAAAISDIAANEPELLNQDRLKKELLKLTELGDREAYKHISDALKLLKDVRESGRLRYGL